MFRSPTSTSFLVGAFAEDGPAYDAFRDAAIYDEVSVLQFVLPGRATDFFYLLIQIPFVAIRDKQLMKIVKLSDRSIVMFKDQNWLAAMPDSTSSSNGYSSSTSLMAFSSDEVGPDSCFCVD